MDTFLFDNHSALKKNSTFLKNNLGVEELRLQVDACRTQKRRQNL